MNKNVGTIDRTVRTIAALAVGVFIFTGTMTGTLAIIFSVVAVALLLTSVVSFCPLYALLKLSSRKPVVTE